MNRPPVTDWATDFDHLDPGFVEDPHAVYSRLRDECPVAHTDRYHGVWIPTRYEDLAAIAHDHQRFSSRTILVTDRAESPTDLGFHAPPITEEAEKYVIEKIFVRTSFSFAEHRCSFLEASRH
mgnify:CR=1 FL=1